ncbi:hypothetical protein PHMEG_00020268 [Phytophthora megakarya]|uniref:Lipid-binding serum glycoprotein N-terminal domain-containing protein n=1 Tax=Phytophthora megakarya TaxID=4795 RepID=A0A225VR22_9STRA|nr:hypothetical protein PHMEG_00020268 [Phytophthora megakarya]
MAKLFALVTAVVVGVLSGLSTAANDSCALIDFTTKESEFTDLNTAIKSTKSVKLLGSVLGSFDPLILNNVTLPDFKYKLSFGRSQTVTPRIDSINITGLKTLTPKHVRVTSANSVEIATYSTGQVAVDVALTFTVPKKSDFFLSGSLKFVVAKPTLSVNVEANIFTCASGESDSSCTDLTVADLLTKITEATTKRQYSSIMKELMMKFKDATVKSVVLDFKSISEYDLDFDSSSFVFRTFFRGASLFKLVPDFSVEAINKRGWEYDYCITAADYYGTPVLNFLIDSMLEPKFGATCLSET